MTSICSRPAIAAGVEVRPFFVVERLGHPGERAPDRLGVTRVRALAIDGIPRDRAPLKAELIES